MMKLTASLASLLIILLVSCNSVAQTTNTVALTPYFIGLVVKDVQIAEAWYQQALNLTTVRAEELPQYGMSLRILAKDNFVLEIFSLDNAISHKDFLPDDKKEALDIGLFKFGFRVADLEQFKQQLITNNIKIYRDIIDDTKSGHRYFFIQDPDGNLIQIFQPMPAS